MNRAPRGQKKADERIERAYQASCYGIQVNVLDIGKVFEVGRKAIAEEDMPDDATLALKIREFVETIRKN
jgi:hypothetical protein